MNTNRVAVLGAGAFGTALALAFARAGRDVTLWDRNAERVAAMANARLCTAALPGLALDPRITPVSDLQRVADVPVLVIAVPAQALRQVCEALSIVLSPGHAVISAAKGMEQGSGQFVTEVMADELGPQRFGVLSGPSFAEDIARGLPTAVSLAMVEAMDAQALAAHSARPVSASTIRRMCGAWRSVRREERAGHCGGHRRRARPWRKRARRDRHPRICRIAAFRGVAGREGRDADGPFRLGDLLLTASSHQSRNFSLGSRWGRANRSRRLGRQARARVPSPPLRSTTWPAHAASTCRSPRACGQSLTARSA